MRPGSPPCRARELFTSPGVRASFCGPEGRQVKVNSISSRPTVTRSTIARLSSRASSNQRVERSSAAEAISSWEAAGFSGSRSRPKAGGLLFELHPRLLNGRVPLPEAVCGQHLLEGVPVVNPRSRQSARIVRAFARMSLAGASPPIAQVFAVAASGINSFASGLGEGSQKSAARCSAAEEPPAWPERISRAVREPVWAAAVLLVRPSAGSAGAVRTAPLCRPFRRSH
jgi:hypothetical protein